MRVPYPVGMVLVFVALMAVALFIHYLVDDIAYLITIPISLVTGWYSSDIARWMAGERAA